MSNWKKYGSPYDPRHQGKMQKPKTAEELRREEQDQHQLRGCGDPLCAICNPETAVMARSGRSTGVTGRFGSQDFSPPIPEEIFRTGRGGIFFSLDDLVGREFSAKIPVMPKDKPPASYTEAREAVEDYICSVPSQSFDDIIGNEDAIGQLIDAIRAPVEHKELYEKYGMKMPKGALLSGPPGCGKTMFARAAAAEMAKLYGEKDKPFEFLSVAGSELQSMYVGQTEGEIKALFTFAREYKAWHGYPLLIFMDECEVILPDRTGRVRRLAPWEESQVATFIAEMDGMQESGAFMLLATNRPEVIDQTVLRDGRCDFKITVKRPTSEAIEAIIRKNFDGCFMKDSLEDLVFAAVESLHDPHKVILEFHALGINKEATELKDVIKDVKQKHFLLEHIVSGAMAASIPTRATRYAFARDKAAGTAKGITTADVVSCVNDLWIENRGLEHSFALDEFRAEFMKEIEDYNREINRKRAH